MAAEAHDRPSQQPDDAASPDRQPRSVRDSLGQDGASDGMLSFLRRLSRFGLVAEGGPVLRPRNFAS